MKKAFYKNNLNFVTIALVYLIGHDERKTEYVHPNSKVVDQPLHLSRLIIRSLESIIEEKNLLHAKFQFCS